MNIQKNKSEYYNLQILDGLELLHAKSHTLDFPFHTHDTFNIALILDTTFTVKLNNRVLKAPMGTLSITNPNEVHATPCNRDLGNSFFTFYVSPEAIKYCNDGLSVFFEDKTIYDQRIFSELYSLSLLHDKNSIDFEDRLITTLKGLVSKYGSIKANDYNTNKMFQTFIAETNFDTFSLDKVAQQFGIDKYKFIRLFKQETGLTPNNYVLLNKIEKGKEMLKTGKPIFDTAIDCGFYDLSHFYRNFKRFNGVNPLDYQNAFIPK